MTYVSLYFVKNTQMYPILHFFSHETFLHRLAFFFFELLLYPRNNAVKQKHEFPIFELRFKIQTRFYYSLIGKRFIPVSFFILRFFIPRYLVIFSSDDSIFDLVLATTTLNIYNRESANFRTLHSED